MTNPVTRDEVMQILGGYGPDMSAELRRLRDAVARAHHRAHVLAISRGIAGTPGEAALFDVCDLLAAALRGES